MCSVPAYSAFRRKNSAPGIKDFFFDFGKRMAKIDKSFVKVRNLKKYFQTGGQIPFITKSPPVRAVENVSFDVFKGETLGVVGESGCGKSTVARLLIIKPDSGEIIIDGRAVDERGGISIRDMRHRMQMVFQDSYATLNPRMPIEESIAFGPISNGKKPPEAIKQSKQVMDHVGLDPNIYLHRYPHELSGGQRQRVNIARALAMGPEVIILDEAVSALDKSVEAQVLNLLTDLKSQLKLTYIFISHDLNVVKYISDKVMVMYLGEVVEYGTVKDVYECPKHPYTKALLASQPSMDPSRKLKTVPITGDPPNPINPPSGCKFHTRCPKVTDLCRSVNPELKSTDNVDHLTACHLASNVAEVDALNAQKGLNS